MATHGGASLPFFEGFNEINNFPVCYTNTQTTNSTTAAGNPTLHFAATLALMRAVVAATLGSGAAISDLTTGSAISGGTTILNAAATTVTMSANVAGSGVGNGDSIQYQANDNWRPALRGKMMFIRLLEATAT